MQYRALSLRLLFLALALAGGCDTTNTSPDAGEPDAGSEPVCAFRGMRWSHPSVGVTPGTTRDVYLELERDYGCDTLEISYETTGTGTVTGLPATTTFRGGESTRAAVQITGGTEGTVTITARGTDASGQARDASIEVNVTSTTLPACDGTASGNVAPGGELEVTTGSIAGARIAVAAGASRDDLYHVDALDAAIACADDALPTGYLALGPAVAFTSADVSRFRREIDFGIPIRLALLPSGANRGHVEVAYTGPGVVAPRIVGIANPSFAGNAATGMLHFQAPRLGTYRAVVRADAPTTRDREFHFRGILGFSMGGSGSGRIGVGNPDLFDFVAPLGGPTDWIYMLEYIRRYHLGGFCSDAEREAGMDCSAASLTYAPPRGELYEHYQHFENWWYEDEYDGQGGRFNRSEYIEIFRDLAAMFGNANTDRTSDESAPNVTPPGMPDTDRFRPNSERCAMENQIRIAPHVDGDTDPATGWFDDEYNPLGQHAVISFCDGAEVDVGHWDPTGSQYIPVEVAYAVDVNGNGLRDAGEPVIRNGRETFRDFGTDGIASAAEPGYDAITNPDPAGDDYDFQYNPTGTESNWEWDAGESYDDFGIDGIDDTAQLADGGYDSGEGNGQFDRTRGAERMIASSPRALVRSYTPEQIAQLDYFADGGVRDLFNWAVMGHHSTGAFAARDIPVRYYNSHSALHLDGRSGDDAFDFAMVPYEEIGRYTMVRYGSIDATEAQKISGDGGHVGTVDQLTNRVYSALAMMDRRWPNGDRRREPDQLCPEISGSCDHVNQFTIDHTAAGRTGPMSVVLPPGYFDEDNADVRYPVVYFLHGYGMEPDDLKALGFLLWNYMNTPTLPESRRIQKMIFVFPDGRCREQECLNGTFYTDAPASTPNGAQMQSFLLDFMDYMDANYRTRTAETIQVVE